ncbi:hypothetical protein [Neptunicella sp. SCSIO 80796]|uniref:hypothetical protein n=1 Tax=Neptunicella plasticusilytica TaxID=3117012 RepID=UPI003A4E65CC
MNLTIAGKNLLLSGAFNPATIVAALFTSADYDNDEVTGGTYVRQAVTYEAPAEGVLPTDAENLAVFGVPAGTAITHGALYIGATQIAAGPVTNESYTGAGEYRLVDADITLSDVA